MFEAVDVVDVGLDQTQRCFFFLLSCFFFFFLLFCFFSKPHVPSCLEAQSQKTKHVAFPNNQVGAGAVPVPAPVASYLPEWAGTLVSFATPIRESAPAGSSSASSTSLSYSASYST